MLIRAETLADIVVVDALLKDVFPTHAEAKLVKHLRENGRRTLALVACAEDGEIIGYVLFSPVTLEQDDFNWQGLAPLAVKASYREQGIGQALVNEGLNSLAELGYPVCMVLGDPKYYARFGFKAAKPLGLSSQWSEYDDALQVYELQEGALKSVTGKVYYSPEFLTLEQ